MKTEDRSQHMQTRANRETSTADLLSDPGAILCDEEARMLNIASVTVSASIAC